jgi:hypothetical protein
MAGAMTEEMLRTIIEVAGSELDKAGTASLPERHLLTLHMAHDGASLSIGRLVRLSLRGEVLTAEDDKGELFVASLSDAYAATISAPSGGSARKAGFIR